MTNPLQQQSLPEIGLPESFYHDYLLTDKAFLALTPDVTSENNQQRYKLANQIIRSGLQHPPSVFEQIMHHYPLDSAEGLYLLRICETLLRCQNNEQALQLIVENLKNGHWFNGNHEYLDSFAGHLKKIPDLSSLALLGGAELANILSTDQTTDSVIQSWLNKVEKKLLLQGVRKFTHYIGKQFVIADDIKSAIDHSAGLVEQSYTASFDMLGEAALTQEEADHYFNAYCEAIIHLGEQGKGIFSVPPSISIKLSALDPQYHLQYWPLLKDRLIPRLNELHHMAQHFNVDITIDAEESQRLELSLLVFDALLSLHHASTPWKIGMAVQAYQKRALSVLKWLGGKSQVLQQEIKIRLVKGAYWDQEIKLAQESGLAGYPVFISKAATDENYMSCARYLLQQSWLSPQFATHNPFTITAIQQMVKELNQNYADIEFQKLFGMGDRIFSNLSEILGQTKVRVYCPVGQQQTLLPYLVRRLLENGSSSSFLNQFYRMSPYSEEILSPESIQHNAKAQNQIPLPESVFEPARANSAGVDLHCSRVINQLYQYPANIKHQDEAYCIVSGSPRYCTRTQPLNAVGDSGRIIGHIHMIADNEVNSVLLHALTTVSHFQPEFSESAPDIRIESIRTFARLLKLHREELLTLLCLEGGKCLSDAENEIREATDFCYFYCSIYEQRLHHPEQVLPSVSGEVNLSIDYPRGTALCISPWNFPLAIFVGQIIAPLLTGNCVIAKPSSATPLIATKVIKLLHEAGIPTSALQLILLPGHQLKDLLAHKAIASIAFTGSTASAKSIQKVIAAQRIDFPTFIAETGGINGMLADSTANPDQVISDALVSAYNMAGQRCSALRFLLVPSELIDRYLSRLQSAIKILNIGPADQPKTDVGPLISHDAVDKFWAYLEKEHFRIVCQSNIPDHLKSNGYYVPPTLMKAERLSDVCVEVFGPLLQVIPFDESNIEDVIHQLNEQAYGLTFSLHTRLRAHIELFKTRLAVGNLYINRNQIGAVVGSQPFGGIKASGTGSKAGGADYLDHFTYKKTISENTAAIGGDLDLLS